MAIIQNPFSQTPKDSVRILQFTDIHLFKDRSTLFDGVNTFDTLIDVIRLARSEHWKPDAVLVTGDLVHDPEESAYLSLKDVLEGLDLPVYCLPGNHDNPALIEALLPGPNINLNKQMIIGNWQIILLNSYVPNSHGGLLDDSELEFLDGCLKTHSERPALVCLHHPPVLIGSSWMDAMALKNREALFAIADKRRNVKCVIWGHIHQEYESERNGVRLLGSPSTCIQFQPKSENFRIDEIGAGYRWLILHKDGNLETGINRVTH